MRGKRRGAIARLGLAAALAFGLVPAAAFADAGAGAETAPPPSRFLRP